jgi:phosphoribosyl 1,2-cyclic phosphodiesterase
MNTPVYIRNLGSSSSGNSTLIWTDQDALLVDIGFGQRYTKERLEEAGVLFSSLRAVLITHLHADHVNQAMLNLVLREGIPVYMHRDLRPLFLRRFKVKHAQSLRTFDGLPFNINAFDIKSFEVPHDAPGGCFGYNIHFQDKKITIATDLSKTENGLAEKFSNSDLIVIESNHDEHLLETSGRSFELIERIKNTGHLSNVQCTSFLNDVLNRSQKMPQAVLLAHLSEDCNLPRLAKSGVQKLLNKWNLKETQLQISKKNLASETIRIL